MKNCSPTWVNVAIKVLIRIFPIPYSPKNDNMTTVAINNSPLKTDARCVFEISNASSIASNPKNNSNPIVNAKKKLNDKNLDAIILNTLSDFSPISSDENKITFISSDNNIQYKKKSKDQVSKDIFEQIIKRCLKK